jgi:hypothetical protein
VAPDRSGTRQRTRATWRWGTIDETGALPRKGYNSRWIVPLADFQVDEKLARLPSGTVRRHATSSALAGPLGGHEGDALAMTLP